MSKKTAIIFGSNGYIGKHLKSSLIAQNYNVYAFDITEPENTQDHSFLKINLLERESLDSINWNVDFVFFFAGLTGTKISFKDYSSFIQLNEIALLNTLDSIKNSNFSPRLVFPSTRLVYKGSDYPLLEESTLLPKTIYAINKIACENYLEIYKNMYEIPYTVFRICVPYGNLLSGNYSFGTIGSLTTAMKTKGFISLYGDGELRRTFTHVEDIVNQIIIACEQDKSKNEIFNIDGENLSLKEISTMLSKKFGGEVKLIPWPKDDLKLESGSTIFDATKLISLSRYKIKHSVLEWIDSLDLNLS